MAPGIYLSAVSMLTFLILYWVSLLDVRGLLSSPFPLLTNTTQMYVCPAERGLNRSHNSHTYLCSRQSLVYFSRLGWSRDDMVHAKYVFSRILTFMNRTKAIGRHYAISRLRNVSELP